MNSEGNFVDKTQTICNHTHMTPALFIGHGSPINALEDNLFTQTWKALADSFPAPKAILVISAHWETHGTFVSTTLNPATIHDFGGFPPELHAFEYPAPGSPELAASIAQTLGIEQDSNWGLDHGAWSVLCHMYPQANIPVLQLSLDTNKSTQEHFNLAERLAYLREEGVFIVGTGNIVHNLGSINWQNGQAYPWSVEFNDSIVTSIISGNFSQVINYQNLGQIANKSVPTPEHFWPLLYVLGAAKPGEKIDIFNNEIVMGSIAMTGVKVR